MKIEKQIRDMPWPEPFEGNPLQQFRMTLSWPVVNHERLLVVTFTWNKNENCKFGWFKGKDLRLICSKKMPAAVVLFKGESRGKRKALDNVIGSYAFSGYPKIGEQDEKALAKWLGKGPKETQNHFLPELTAWVRSAISAEILRERDDRGELRDEDVDLCPDELPAGLERFIRARVLPNDHVLIYRKGNVRGLCYACGREVRARNQRFRQNEVTRCPDCGTVVSCYLRGSDRFKADYVQNIATIQKGTDGKTLFIRQWHLLRDPTAKWESVTGFLEEICRYAIRGNRVAKWQREYKEAYYMNAIRCRANCWIRRGNPTEVYDGLYYFFCPDDWRGILSGTSMQYCDFQRYCTDVLLTDYGNPIRFLVDWARYPAIEKLWKAGYTNLVNERIERPRKEIRNTIRWNKISIREAVRFPTRLLKIYTPEDWTMADVQKVTDLWHKVQEGSLQERDVPELARSMANMEHIEYAMGHASVHKILQYIAKGVEAERESRKKEKNTWKGRPFETPDTYRDYLKDCVALRLNLDDKDVLFPRDLKAAHARTIAEVKYQADSAKKELFFRETQRLKWMEWEKDGLLIRLPVDAKELIAEGAYLHHCVGGYADRMANGKTTILLIRRAEEPDTPFYTLEWLNGKVQQCRTMRNASYENDEQVHDFVTEWVKKIAKKGKKKKAATSAA